MALIFGNIIIIILVNLYFVCIIYCTWP